MKKIIISENAYKKLFLLEANTSKNPDKARKYLYNVCKFAHEEDKAPNETKVWQYVEKVKNQFNNLKILNNYFLPLAVRFAYENEFMTAEDESVFNNILPIMSNHVDDFKKIDGVNYNTFPKLSLEDLKSKYYNEYFEGLNNDRYKLKSMALNGEFGHLSNNYDIIAIPDFSTAKMYGGYTSWCITRLNGMYNSYTKDGLGTFYFLLRKDYENINKPSEPDGNPKDDYGMSMIAISIDDNGNLVTSTSRWNHSNNGNDNLFTTEEISKLIGGNFYDIFVPKYTKKQLLDTIVENAKELNKISDTLSSVQYKGRYYIIKDGKLLLNEYGSLVYFDDVYEPDSNKNCIVKLKFKYTLINNDGNNIVKGRWFDKINGPNGKGVYKVQSSIKRTLVDANGKFIFGNKWFNSIDDNPDCNGNYWVVYNGRRCVIKPDGEYLLGGDISGAICNADANGNYKVLRNNGDLLLNPNGDLIGNNNVVNIYGPDANNNYILKTINGYILVNALGGTLLEDGLCEYISVPDFNNNYNVDLNGGHALVNSTGNFICGNTIFDRILGPYKDGSYRMFLNGVWLVFDDKTLDIKNKNGDIIGNIKNSNFSLEQIGSNAMHESVNLDKIIKSATKNIIRRRLMR